MLNIEFSVDFAVSFKFQNTYHSFIANLFIDDIVKKNIQSFLDRAHVVYGPQQSVIQHSEIIKQSKKITDF